MKWLQRLKTATCPEADATKATEPGFVGFVAPVSALLQKTAAPANAANDSVHTLKKPETAPWRVTLAPGTSAATAEKFRAASLALDQLIEGSNHGAAGALHRQGDEADRCRSAGRQTGGAGP